MKVTRVYLGPVTEHLPVTPIGHKLLGELKSKKQPCHREKKLWNAFNKHRFTEVCQETHLSNRWVQVVHDHKHQRRCLLCAAWVLIYGVRPGGGKLSSLPRRNSRQVENTNMSFTADCVVSSPHVQCGAEAIHVDVTVLPQLLSEFRCKSCVMGGREVPQGICQGQLKDVCMYSGLVTTMPTGVWIKPNRPATQRQVDSVGLCLS